jgi:hypothetical protein
LRGRQHVSLRVKHAGWRFDHMPVIGIDDIFDDAAPQVAQQQAQPPVLLKGAPA